MFRELPCVSVSQTTLKKHSPCTSFGGLTDVELFSKVKIAPEQTVTRAFYLEKDEGDFARTLTWCMAGGTVTNVDVVVDSFWGKFE